MTAATAYAARDQAAEGTQAAPPLLNVTVGNPPIRNTNVGLGITGQVAGPTGGTDRPNTN